MLSLFISVLSCAVGYVVAAISRKVKNKGLITTFISLAFPLIILFVPLADTSLAIIRRKLKGQKIDQADKEHLDHQLLKHFSKKNLIILSDLSS